MVYTDQTCSSTISLNKNDNSNFVLECQNLFLLRWFVRFAREASPNAVLCRNEVQLYLSIALSCKELRKQVVWMGDILMEYSIWYMRQTLHKSLEEYLQENFIPLLFKSALASSISWKNWKWVGSFTCEISEIIYYVSHDNHFRLTFLSSSEASTQSLNVATR